MHFQLQVFELEDSLAKHWRREIVARIHLRKAQGTQDIDYFHPADIEFFGELVRIQRFYFSY